MDAADKRMLDREALRNMIQQWNANRLDLFELSEPNENLEFHGVMRFYFQDSGQKIATKCIRVASDATVSDVIETLIEKFRPDMRMLSLGSYSLWETHGPDDERRLEPHEKPLLVQLNWHADDREGRFLLKCLTHNEVPLSTVNEKADQNFKRKLSKREKKELKKKEKLSRLKSDTNDENRPVAEKLYTELPETSFTRSISNPEAVMRRRRQQKLERKLQQFRSKDGGPDTGGTLKIYGSSLCPDVPYKTLLLSVGDTAAGVVRETLDKYGLARHDPHHYCLVQVDTADNSEYILEDDECPLAIVMTHPHHSSIMFHVRRRPTDSQPRRRKKKAGAGAGAGSARPGNEPMLLEVAPDGSTLENGRRLRITDLVEVGSGNGTALQLYGPSIQPRHCVLAPADGGGYTVTPLHADAHVYVNGRRAMHTQRLQHGCLLKFGRVSTFRFVDPAQENLMNRNLSQSQHFGSGSIYDRSPTSGGENSGAMSPTSLASHAADAYDPNANATDPDYPRPLSPASHDTYGYNANDTVPPYNNNTLKLDNESIMLSQHLNDSKDDYLRDEHSGSVYNDQEQSATPNRLANSQYKDNYETTFDLDGNVETKSICSAKSGGSGHDSRLNAAAMGARPGQEAILPAVLEFPEAGQAQFLAAVITRLDPHAPAFKLAPVYTLYLCARYRASTHYRPELTPTERAHKLTAFLHHVATLIHATVQERCTDSAAQAFWMANASELLHFLKCDRHISSFSTQAQDLLPTTVQNAFSNLVGCFQEELSRALGELTSAAGAAGAAGGAGGAGGGAADATDATAPTLRALAAAMVLLRRCRVNAALTIQLFSHLFHYINAVCFNKLVTEQGSVNARWGAALSARLALLAAWAERQGLELAADCHLARTHQAARLIQGEYRTAEEVIAALEGCCKLNSVQVRALLTPIAPPDVVEAAVAHTRAHADELYRADGREIRLEESWWLGAALLIPGDGFSAEVVRGVPPGLAEFVAPLQRGGLCRLAHQPHALGLWTVYLAPRARRPAPDAAAPRRAIVTLHKNANGMGLSIVAAKGAGQSKLGIYIKSVVPGGAAAADGRLAAGDQLLSVDGHSLVGITQEKAAEYLVRTGPTVTLEVAKQGAVLHGLATLLHQPAYNQRQEEEVQYEDRARRNSGKSINPHPALLRPASPLTELATAGTGYGRRPFHNRCRLLRDESTESSTDESEELRPHYHGSIPRLIITLDRENEQLQDDLSPETPSCPLELRTGPPPTRQIPIFTFTCEDMDEKRDDYSNSVQRDTYVPQDVPPIVPEPPTYYEQSSENGETICLPPQMKPIDTKLTLDLFNSRCKENEPYRRRCTGIDECVSACECCRSPQPEAQQIPFIDEPNSEPVIFENDTCVPDKFPTPKIRRILPSLSLDQSEECKPETADATCQTSSSPSLLEPESQQLMPSETPLHRKLELCLNIKDETRNIESVHCRLKRTLVNISRSLSSKSEDTEALSTFSTYGSYNEDPVNKCLEPICVNKAVENNGEKQILESVDRKSWKSPDEYRPAFGKVKALAKHFNSMNLRYCAKNYKRNCQSSPNLSTRPDAGLKIKDSLPLSASLADILYDRTPTETSESKTGKMSEDEVKSIMIQLEDWSQFGSRGSEDTLAQGNEFELPNLPSEEHSDVCASNIGSYVFNEIIDKKPRTITLDTITLKCKRPSVTSEQRSSAASCPDVSACADISSPSGGPGGVGGGGGGGGGVGAMRRASERDLPARLAAEPVKPSKSTPALHHASHHHPQSTQHHYQHQHQHQHASPHATQSPPLGGGGSIAGRSTGTVGATGAAGAAGAAGEAAAAGAWAHKSRSSHNLAAHPPDAFYQNLPAVHSQHRWSSLRSSSGSNRPQSAHFAAAAESPADATGTLHNQSNQSSAASVRAAKLAEMSEEVTRRQQQQQQQQHQQQLHQQQMQQQHQLQQQQQHQLQQQQLGSQQLHVHAGAQYSPQLLPHQHQPQQYMQSPPQGYHAQQQQHQHQPQRYDWHPPGPPSPQRAQPPVAPKPTGTRKSDTELEEQLVIQQQHMMNNSTVQPDDERYVASASDPPAVSMYPAGGAAAGARGPPAHNPWQREERERQAEARRAQARARRDAAIAQLVALGSARTPVQNQQLRALQLERDFERRATQHEHDDGGNAEAEPDEEDSSPPSSPPATLQMQPTHHTPQNTYNQHTSHTSYATHMTHTTHSTHTTHAMHTSQSTPAALTTQTHEETRAPPPHPPKSILKTNRPEVTNGYAGDMQHTQEDGSSRVSELTSGLASASVSGGGPPAPPERGSSFAVMAGRRAVSPPHPHPHPPHAIHHQQDVPPPHSPVGASRDKRVSFHERAAAAAAPASPSPSPSPPPSPGAAPPAAPSAAPSAAPPAPPASSPPPLDPPAREDPDRFIEEAETMLAGGPSPAAPSLAAHTPGVIGAQEVYRDPRTRRLAEREARAAAAPVPEHLSFKEKMKMFALESGEASTPKDKVKISRAQRDIDAVR